ncbi:MAG TPA: acyltransferase [Rhizomicrobium sp.]|nr:acyltransferase [Rhizomicrobium sp.]
MGKTRFTGLDGLRGVCALAILLEHCERLFRPGVIFCHGWLAVDMFFILSGFVIASCYDRRLADGLTARQFAGLRIRRLTPVYWAGLVLCAAASLAQSYFEGSPSPWRVLSSAAMAAFLVPHLGDGNFAYPANPVAWTLAWELAVNILYAAGLWRARTRLLLALIAPMLAGAVVMSFSTHSGWSFGMSGLDIGLGWLRALPEFLMGVLLHRAFKAGKFASLPAVTPLLPLGVWLVMAVQPQGLSPLLDFAMVVLIFPLLVALLVRGEAAAPAWFAPLGAISYSLYASHLALIWLAWHTPWLGLNHGPRPVLAAGLALAALGLAWLLYRLVDPAAKARASADLRPRKAPVGAGDPAPESA